MDAIKVWFAEVKMYILLALLVAFAVAYWWHGHAEYDKGAAAGQAQVTTLKATYAQATAKAEADARSKERAATAAMVQIQDTYYQQGVIDANAKADAVVAGLRAGTLRLRRQWRGCEATSGVRQAATGAGEPDAIAEQRSQGARDLVRLGAQADAQIRALQAVIRADRKQ